MELSASKFPLRSVGSPANCVWTSKLTAHLVVLATINRFGYKFRNNKAFWYSTKRFGTKYSNQLRRRTLALSASKFPFRSVGSPPPLDTPDCSMNPFTCRSTSLIRNTPLLGTYSRTLPRAIWWSERGRPLLMSEVPLYSL